MKTVGFLGFGEAARAFHATLATALPGASWIAWDIKLTGDDPAPMRAAIVGSEVDVVAGPEALTEAHWIFSAVTADQSLDALAPLLPALGPGTTVVDINSVAPAKKQEAAARVEATGAAYLDMAVMAPVIPNGHRTPVLVAGHDVPAAASFLDDAHFHWTRVGDAPGRATAIKMVRSVFVKGLEAITAEALLAAERSDCLPEILASLSNSFPGLGWPGHAHYVFDRTLTHGARRAAEMREVAATLDDLGLAGHLAAAVAEVQDRLGEAGTAALDPHSLEKTLARTLAARLGGEGG